MCGEYIGTFARLPRFVELYPTGRSMETLISVVDNSERLEEILEPNYVLDCARLDHEDVVPYGYVAVDKTPYATWFSHLGDWWTRSPWYVKIGMSIGIVLVSLWLGGSTLLILPLIW